MGFLNKYPYTDFHELNLDYILEILKTVETTLTDFVSLNAIKYADPIQWSITRQYENNTVVIDPLTGTGYISVAPVPIGVALTRTEYWTVVFDLESFVTKASENFANTYEAQTTTTATQATPQYGWIVWGGLLYVANTAITPGDAYVIGGNISRITVEDICGHIETLNTTDKTNLVAAINEVLASLISTAGDLSQLSTVDQSNLVAAINEVITTFNGAVLSIQNDMGDLATLSTTDKSSLVNAINEVLTTLASVAGDLADLDTTDKSNLVAAINEVLSDLGSAVSTIDGLMGDLADLNTIDKTSIVNAINEVLSDLGNAVSTIDNVTGDLADLITTDKTSLVNAINEVVSDLAGLVTTIGDLADLNTSDKSSVVNAINEVLAGLSSLSSDVGNLASLNTTNKSSIVAAINEVLAASHDVATPQMYGAVGDGVTDDYIAFRNMLDEHKYVFIPAGTYLIGSTINLNGDGYVITGAGIANTIIKCGDNGIAITSHRNIIIRDLSLRDNVNVTHAGITLISAYNVQLDNVYLYDFDTAISFETVFSWDIFFNHVRLNDCSVGISDSISGNITNFYANDLYCDGCTTSIAANTIRAKIENSRFGIRNADAIIITSTSDVVFSFVDFECDSAVPSGVVLNFKGQRFEFHECKFIYSNSSGISYFIDPLGSGYMYFHNCTKAGDDDKFINVDNMSNSAGYGHLVFDSYLMNSVYDEIIANGTAGDALKVRNLDYNGLRSKKGGTYNTTYLHEGEIVFDPVNHTLHYFDGTTLNTITQS